MSVKDYIIPLNTENPDFAQLLDAIGDAQFVLLGEASHGTHEFYQLRAEITKELILKKNFNIVTAEADWPDAYRIDRFIKGQSNDKTSNEALSDFNRFPSWMWRNEDVENFVSWLYPYNKGSSPVSFYGLDLYSLHSSMNAVINYLDKVDQDLAKAAKERYSCFDHFGEDPQRYGYAASFNGEISCRDEVVRQLIELRNNSYDLIQKDGIMPEDEFFYAEQNALVAKNAEEYYRKMFEGQISTWNLRDSHMMQTLESIIRHHEKTHRSPKAVVWAHNSHLGDARATEMGLRGEINLGQLVREKYGEKTFSVGFSTYIGTVTAADDWDEPAQKMKVNPGLRNSYEQFFHSFDIPDFILIPDEKIELKQMLQRAIGVIYRPRTERISHYFMADLKNQFNALIHIDNTSAVVPLDRTEHWVEEELPETYPFGL
jgi:erythromycin esterase-like protein